MMGTVTTWTTASAAWLNVCDSCKTRSLDHMKTVPPAADFDPRQTGWQCMGAHKPGRERSNQYALWTACSRCGLRLSYVAKGRHQGDTRAVGPPRDLVIQAQEELRVEFAPTDMNEKIFQGKLMEVKGRELVNSHGAGRTTVQVRADERLGQLMMNEPPKAKGAKAKSAATSPIPEEHIAEMAPPTSRTPKTPSRRSTSPTRTPGTESSPTTPEEESFNPPSRPIKKEKPVEAKKKEVMVEATEVLTISDDEMVSSAEEEKTMEKPKKSQGK